MDFTDVIEVFYKKDILKNYAKSQKKNLCWSLFFHKIVGLTAANLLKRRLLALNGLIFNYHYPYHHCCHLYQ